MDANCNYESLLKRKIFCTKVKQHLIKVAIGFKSLLTTILVKLTTILTTTDFNCGERGRSQSDCQIGSVRHRKEMLPAKIEKKKMSQ